MELGLDDWLVSQVPLTTTDPVVIVENEIRVGSVLYGEPRFPAMLFLIYSMTIMKAWSSAAVEAAVGLEKVILNPTF